MEPWDGPAAHLRHRRPLGGRRPGPQRPAAAALHPHRRRPAGRRLRDRHGARSTSSEIVEKGRVGPGQMIARRPRRRPPLPAPRDQGSNCAAGSTLRRVDREHHRSRQADASQPGRARGSSSATSCAAASSRPASRMEDLELILQPMVEEAKEAVGSMGDDTPLAVLSEQYRGLHHFFRQNFSQVTNPPIDSPARSAGDEAEDAVRQSRQHPRRGRKPVRVCCSSKSRSC